MHKNALILLFVVASFSWGQSIPVAAPGLMTEGGPTIAGAPTIPTSGLEIHWRIDEGTGNLTDSSGNGITGTLTGGVTWTTSGGEDVITFDGISGSFVDSAYTTALGDFTVIVVFNDSGDVQSLERLGDKDYNGGFWTGRANTGSNSWGGGVDETTTPFGRYVTLSDGAWHMLTSRREGTTHTIIGDRNSVNTSGTVTSAALNGTNFELGRNSSGGIDLYDSLIGYVLLYNRALSDSEVVDIYDAIDAEKPGLSLP